MYCKNCMAPLSSEDTFCKVCGKPVEEEKKEEIKEEVKEPTYIRPIEEVEPIIEQKANYAVPTEPIMMNEQAQSPVMEPVAPSVNETPAIEPVQILEQTNTFKPVIDEDVQSVRMEPAPIINKQEGVSKKVFLLGIGVSVVAAFLIALLIFIPITSSKVNKVKKDAEKNVVTKTVTENRIVSAGYSFKLPEGYSFKTAGNYLIIENDTTKEAMALQVYNETYANLKANLTVLKTSLTNAKWIVGKMYMDQNVKNKLYLEVEATLNNQKVLIAYTQASSTQSFGIVYLNPNDATSFPINSVQTFNEIVESASPVKQANDSKVVAFTKNAIFFPKTTK